jgi:hypothetical protein
MDIGYLGNSVTIKTIGQILKFKGIFEHLEIILALVHSIQQSSKGQSGYSKSDHTQKPAPFRKAELLGGTKKSLVGPTKNPKNIFGKQKKNNDQLKGQHGQQKAKGITFWPTQYTTCFLSCRKLIDEIDQYGQGNHKV